MSRVRVFNPEQTARRNEQWRKRRAECQDDSVPKTNSKEKKDRIALGLEIAKWHAGGGMSFSDMAMFAGCSEVALRATCDKAMRTVINLVLYTNKELGHTLRDEFRALTSGDRRTATMTQKARAQ